LKRLLNRVTGTALSQIDGKLSATGKLYLINPQSVVVGPTGIVSTGGRFVASGLGADNTAFMAGRDLAVADALSEGDGCPGPELACADPAARTLLVASFNLCPERRQTAALKLLAVAWSFVYVVD
jgi:hypothetical protein